VALTIGIVGLPNVGKSTLFNALTKNSVLAANYPFATIEPNVGVVNLPDARLNVLAEIFGSERILPAAVSFVDIAGIVKGASEGEGLGNQFLANIREADAIAQVVRGFADPDVVHVDGAVNPKSDMETINTELILADLQTIEKAHPRIEKEVKAKKTEPGVLETLEEARAVLDSGMPLSSSKVDVTPIRELGLLTAKPFIYVFNVDESVLTDAAKRAELEALVAPAKAVLLDAKLESELIDLSPEDCWPRRVSRSRGSTNSRASASTRWACRRISLPGPRNRARGQSARGGKLRKLPASFTLTSKKASSRPRSFHSATSWSVVPLRKLVPRARPAWKARTTS